MDFSNLNFLMSGKKWPFLLLFSVYEKLKQIFAVYIVILKKGKLKSPGVAFKNEFVPHPYLFHYNDRNFFVLGVCGLVLTQIYHAWLSMVLA